MHHCFSRGTDPKNEGLTPDVLQVMGDEEFNRWSRELAQQQAEEGQAIICVNIKRIRETRSRIEELELAEVIR